MKNLFWSFLSLILIMWTTSVRAQVEVHTKESIAIDPKTAKVGDQVELCFYITIDRDWYVYSSELKVEGPLPTTFSFKPNKSYQLIGKVRPINPKKKMDEVWEGEVAYFEKKAEFRQKIKILDPNLKVEGAFEYSVCSMVTGQCLPPTTYDFVFDKSQIKIAAVETPKEEKNRDAKSDIDNPKSEIDNKSDIDNPKSENNDKSDIDNPKSEIDNKSTIDNPKSETIKSDETNPADASLLTFMLLAFVAGMTALLTPCVFPMIPMTVTFFTKQSKTRAEGIQKAIFYGLSIIVIYTFLGVLVSFLFGATFNNWLSTHWLPNLFFFGLLVFFGVSFLGMFEIVLPSSLVNKADAQADKGGYYGIFFMAFVLALVSFSCTAPIAGSILILASQGVWFKPIMGMITYSSAIAIPFALFAMFPAWLNSLPKSGGWLNSVKVVLGFLELALALKFLSTADQVYHWNILPREIFLALWIVIFSLIGFYLLGKIMLPHDSKLEKVPVPRVVLAIFSFAFVVYMIPGMFGAPLRPLAGYLPPQTAENFSIASQHSDNQFVSNKSNSKVRFGDLLHLPHGLSGFFDYKEGLAYAKKVNKPIFIDFTGHGCVNCREMEARVWSNPEVLKRLNNDYVVIALYVDDRTELPEKEWFTSTYDKKVKKTIGAQNADFQIVKYNNNAQPYYCLLDHQGKLLVSPKAYDLNPDNFVEFLDKGLEKFKSSDLASK
ncbi:MAG: thioredoxin family protein [Microscillaceae bacterium]|jgi:thiol:disulfide interchange protein DsbD|nr:thioredoxin family protein [Microscillaceae bacterium]